MPIPELSAQPTPLDLAIQFAKATYEKKDGTDERAVFDILGQVGKLDAAGKREFEETLTAMARTNRVNSLSYYEKVTANTAEGGFVERILEDEMKGWLIRSEFKQAMSLWRPNLAPIPRHALEDFSEGFLNSIAAMGDSTLEHPWISGAAIGMAAGFTLAGVLPIVATGSVGIKLIAQVPRALEALHWLGTGAAGYFSIKSLKAAAEVYESPDPILRGEKWRECGENFGAALLFFGGGKSGRKAQHRRGLSSQKSEQMKNTEITAAKSEAKPSLEKPPTPNFTKQSLRRSLLDMEDTQFEKLDTASILSALIESDPKVAERDFELVGQLYARAQSRLTLWEKLRIQQYAVILPTEKRKAFLLLLPQDNEPLLVAMRNFLTASAENNPLVTFQKMLDYLEAAIATKVNFSHLDPTYNHLEYWVALDFIPEVSVPASETDKLLRVLASSAPQTHRELGIWLRLFQKIDLETLRNIQTDLTLRQLSLPSREGPLTEFLDCLNLLIEFRQSPSDRIVSLKLYSSRTPSILRDLASDRFRTALLQTNEERAEPFLLGIGKDASGTPIVWKTTPQPDLTHLEISSLRLHSADLVYNIESRDPQVIEEAFFRLLEKTGNTGDILRIPIDERKVPFREMKDANGGPLVWLSKISD